MRAYRKTTQHPFCLYLTAEEAAAFLEDLEAVTSEEWAVHLFTLERVQARLSAVVNAQKEA